MNLNLSRQRPISYRNQSIDLQSKSMDWFLYDIGLRRQRVKPKTNLNLSPYLNKNYMVPLESLEFHVLHSKIYGTWILVSGLRSKISESFFLLMASIFWAQIPKPQGSKSRSSTLPNWKQLILQNNLLFANITYWLTK